MKPIQIANRLRPFSHSPGVETLVPKTSTIAKIYPTRILFSSGEVLSIPLTGPVVNFTVTADLESHKIFVCGVAREGYFRYVIRRDGKEIITQLCKGAIALKTNTIPCKDPFIKANVEKLCLGIHKKQDMDLMRRRCDLHELLPFLYRVGQITPINGSTDMSELDLKTLFLHNFSGIFSPAEEKHLGISLDNLPENANLLRAISKQIRTYFVQEKEGEITVLPSLPKSMKSGRMVDLKLQNAVLDLHWSKGVIRRVLIKSNIDQEITFQFTGNIRTYRKGSIKRKNGDALALKAGEVYLLDRFEK